MVVSMSDGIKLDSAKTLHRKNQLNIHLIPKGYFSVLDEVCRHFSDKIYKRGCTVESSDEVDKRLGEIFAKYLRENGLYDENRKRYLQIDVNGKPAILCNLYPTNLRRNFKIVFDKWMNDGSAYRFFNKHKPRLWMRELNNLRHDITSTRLPHMSRAKKMYVEHKKAKNKLPKE